MVLPRIPKASLKATLPALSEILGVTVDALYARQRTLVYEGILEAKHGRGPGSGTPATFLNVAILLVALLADERGLSPSAARHLLNAKPFSDLPRTKSKRFGQTIEAILEGPGPEFAKPGQWSDWWPNSISVCRDTLVGTINWPKHVGGPDTLYDFNPSGKLPRAKGLRIVASLDRRALIQIRDAIAEVETWATLQAVAARKDHSK